MDFRDASTLVLALGALLLAVLALSVYPVLRVFHWQRLTQWLDSEGGVAHDIGERGFSVPHTKSNTDLVLRSIRARQEFWTELRDRARLAKNDQAAGEAQRLIDEYAAFIDILKRNSSEHVTGYMQARR
jgi:hypothetical protein